MGNKKRVTNKTQLGKKVWKSLEVKETKHRETKKFEHAKRRGVSMPTITSN